jgi:phytanoyl-CoA hydroxylase
MKAALQAIDVAAFERDGYAIARGLFGPDELAELMGTFDELYSRRSIPGCFEAIPPAPGADPLNVYPRMMHPHRVSPTAMRYMLHPKLEPLLGALLGEAPLAAQSMFYWKPPSARGQALHQDNYYLRVRPGTCLAAWVAVDRADRQNGGLSVVPGSQRLQVLCPEEADLSVSFSGDLVSVPKDLHEVPVDLDAGDVLFFGGSLIHGSEPNRSAGRFRRSFICHYAGESAQEVSPYYKPLYRFDGTEVDLRDATGGGPCGAAEASGPH